MGSKIPANRKILTTMLKDVLNKMQGLMDEIDKTFEEDDNCGLFLDALQQDLEKVFNKFCAYRWKAECNDGAYEDHSKQAFKTQEECYNDMRNAVLEKMKWNTQYKEDFFDASLIKYEVTFSPDKIVHTSYSGVYTYTIERVYDFKCNVN